MRAHVRLVGNFHPLGKFVIMAVMIRGRHRALPFAVSIGQRQPLISIQIDRAVMLPKSINEAEDAAFEEEIHRLETAPVSPSIPMSPLLPTAGPSVS